MLIAGGLTHKGLLRHPCLMRDCLLRYECWYAAGRLGGVDVDHCSPLQPLRTGRAALKIVGLQAAESLPTRKADQQLCKCPSPPMRLGVLCVD